MASSGQLSTRSRLLSWASALPPPTVAVPVRSLLSCCAAPWSPPTVAVAVRSLLSCCAAPWSPPWPLSRAKAGPARPRTRQGSMAVRSLRTGLLHPWGVLPTFRPVEEAVEVLLVVPELGEPPGLAAAVDLLGL